MSRQIYVNLPVKDLKRSMEFFNELGFSFNPQFTDEKAACMVIDENIYVMLLTESFFQTFTQKKITDAGKSTEVLVCISLESRGQVDEIVKRAVDAGAKSAMTPQDHGFMYGHGFHDLDGHIWELIYMDPSNSH